MTLIEEIDIMRLTTILLWLCLYCGVAGCGARDGVSDIEHARALARTELIVDTHIDLPYRLYRRPEDVTQATSGDFDYPRALAGGLNAAFMSIFVPAAVDADGRATELANELIDLVENIARDAPDKFAVATCTHDVGAIRASGRIALPMGMENGGPIAGDLDNLDHFFERGIRYITLAHSKSNHISDSSYDDNEPWEGLSPFGKELVVAMNHRGVMIDVSHLSDRAFWQVLELSSAPVVATHSSLRHFVPGFHRNMTDEMVAALGRSGGVIQINFGSSFVAAEARASSDAMTAAMNAFAGTQELRYDDPALRDFAARYRAEHPYPYADLEDVLNHIDRAVSLAGVEHVGIGSDYDGVGDTLPTGLKDVSSYPNLIEGLASRGYDDQQIALILGGNLMRVWKQVEVTADARGYPPACRHAQPTQA